MTIAHEFILGGQKSGKSRRAEQRAIDWMAEAPAARRAVLIATAQAFDDEMRERIARHQADRARRVPAMRTVEEPVELARAIVSESAPETLVVVDCLTLWLTNLLMPLRSEGAKPATRTPAAHVAMLLIALREARGPVVLVGNEIGLGVIPLGRETRAFVDTLGRMNQEVAAACHRVTLMAAGLPLTLKAPAA
ncbi:MULTISPECIES: bifunctional adenosylcobinamide kinase/adenosylcobinamide-phosphate guanylyltransferase [Variovorax]|uniref:Bifunctional adenosylcobalamin biosynthesis protein n=2 Tax=Variovorax paradoxus TaxID=34073 RepID=A0A6I6HQ60_VARPD|nr:MULTISPECIES: bifunctional adenosylcobinamide kinase/adenosylcobinamide-phosphate guanylyltransferase [Variovorax]QGW85030.1 bifunctional adenosylcobinamide kinase/adenosylcobinamide-phosphate guanylyltransferase [Variovorax paradoxus]RST46116.1 bifunctional adenosylcobinamide kinase/adenosylcobinamide-phosphate guanylyltransferase [Variovorax sp. DXTD-1]